MPNPAHRAPTAAAAADAVDAAFEARRADASGAVRADDVVEPIGRGVAVDGAGDPAFVPVAAAVVHDGRADIDALLADVARAAARGGRRVRGLLMQRTPAPGAPDDCVGAMVLVDLHAGERFVVSQDLGPGASGCRVDPRGFVRAGRVLRDALGEAAAGGVDLVVVNRYGKLEASGEGFADEMLELMAAGVPLLTAVAPRQRDAWAAFSGGAAALPAERDAIEAWIAQAASPGVAAGAPAGLTRP